MYQCLLQENQDGLCIIKLNRPEVYNAFNAEMASELKDALNKSNFDDSVRAIMLTGEGKAFSSGQDLADIGDLSNVDFESILDNQYNPLVRELNNIQKPTIAFVNGVAAGAGANLALCFDILLASEKASFIQAFANIGLVPDTAGTYYLPRAVGYKNATALMLTGDKLSAPRAKEMGMVYEVYPEEMAYDEALKFSKRLSQMPTKALVATKNLLSSSQSNDLIKQISAEKDAQVEMGKTDDFLEGVNAFKEKRPPEFKGQ